MYNLFLFCTPNDQVDPFNFPPPGPYWTAGWRGTNSTIIRAYLPSNVSLHSFWPEADDIKLLSCGPIEYYDRYPKPDWYQESTPLVFTVGGTEEGSLKEDFNRWLNQGSGKRIANT